MIALEAQNHQTRVETEHTLNECESFTIMDLDVMFVSQNFNPWEMCAALYGRVNTPILLHFLELILMTILYGSELIFEMMKILLANMQSNSRI